MGNLESGIKEGEKKQAQILQAVCVCARAHTRVYVGKLSMK